MIGVFAEADEPLDSSIGQHFSTKDAGCVGAIYGSAFQTDTVQRSLDDAVLFGVNGPANLVASAGRDVLFISQAAQFKAILYPCGGAIVSGGKNVFIPDRHSTNVMS